MEMNDRIKCRFCNWSTVKRYSRGGKYRGIGSAHERLLSHVHEFHRAEYDKVQELLQRQED